MKANGLAQSKKAARQKSSRSSQPAGPSSSFDAPIPTLRLGIYQHLQPESMALFDSSVSEAQGVGAGLHGFGLSEDADPLASPTAAGAQFPREFEGAPEVQDEISRRKLAGVRTSPRGARRRDTLALRRRDGRVETCAVWSAGRAEEMLGPRDRDRIDAPARLPVALAPDRGLLAVGPGLEAPRPRSARSHHALAAESAPRGVGARLFRHAPGGRVDSLASCAA